jgi:hypothetical protein
VRQGTVARRTKCKRFLPIREVPMSAPRTSANGKVVKVGDKVWSWGNRCNLCTVLSITDNVARVDDLHGKTFTISWPEMRQYWYVEE